LFIDTTKHNRSTLKVDNKEFLATAAPLARYISQQTKAKVNWKGIRSVGIYPSLILAHILIESDFGSHPLAQIKYIDEKGKKKWANNLTMLESHKYWHGHKIKYEGKEYRGFKNHSDFATSLSDTWAFNQEFVDISSAPTLSQQLKLFGLTKSHPILYTSKMETFISYYNLSEWDQYGEEF
jgi:flagellum-specific peptidoglycan hydrolase FlgJ